MEQDDFVQLTRRADMTEDDFYPLIRTMYERLWTNLLPPQLPTDGLSARRAKNVVTPPDAPVPDCLTCGACCAAMLCVGVRPSESGLSADDYWDVTVEGADGTVTVDRYLRRDPSTFFCAALDVRDDGRALCRVYERRPQMCRDFEAGSDKCHALRRAFGLEPFLSLDEMSAARQKLKQAPVAVARGDVIREAKFVPAGNGAWEISAFLKDGSVKTIHRFDPRRESWRQFEFDGLTLDEAENLIAARKI